ALKRVIIIIIRHDALLSCGILLASQSQYTTFGAVMPYFLFASFGTRPDVRDFLEEELGSL
ncbi:MAG: hypothetical protein IJS09_07595, partial [Treponema sp.]|nr:hypothetical protein [Treponema sp.]